LTASTTYYVRAYATNSIGTSYGNQVNFIASATPPTVTSKIVKNGSLIVKSSTKIVKHTQ